MKLLQMKSQLNQDETIPGFKTLLLCFLGIFVFAFALRVSAQNMVNGVDVSSAVSKSATIKGTSFDPPCSFMDTLPLMSAPYMDPGTIAHYIDGEGAVLDECSNFSVTGYSSPNFLAWNCLARNADGTRSKLPAEIRFSQPVSRVSISVGSETDQGKKVLLKAYNAAHFRVSQSSVTLSTNMQRLSVSYSNRIRYIKLEGPCIMIADDMIVVR